jgi:hypothetical protein
MRDPARIKKILELIENYWNKNPDLRMFQLLINLCPDTTTCSYCLGSGYFMEKTCMRCLGCGFINFSNYHIEDSALLEKLETLCITRG